MEIKAPVEMAKKTLSFSLDEDVCDHLENYAQYLDPTATDRRLAYIRTYVVTQALLEVFRNKKYQAWLEKEGDKLVKADKAKAKENGR